MLICNEYLLVRAVLGTSPADLPNGPIAVTTGTYWRLLNRLHRASQPNPTPTGPTSRRLGDPGPNATAALTNPDPEVFTVLDPRPFMNRAAAIATTFRGFNWHIAEMTAAALFHDASLHFGRARNVPPTLARTATQLALDIHIHEQ